MIRNHKSDGGASVFASAKIARRSFLGLSGAVGAAAALAASVPAAPAKAREWKRRPTFVLIHGSWHGAWCFQLTASLLINEGFRVVALDRPGSGLNAQFPSSYLAGNLNPNEVSPVAGVTLDDYATAAVESIIALRGDEPVIVVGHSLGGIVVNEVGERLGPEGVDHLVYLTAFMTPAGKTGNDIINMDAQFGSLTRTVLLGSIAVTGVARINPNSTDPAYQASAVNTFYNDVPAEMIPAIFNLLTPDDPAAPCSVVTNITPHRWGAIPRTFIRCTLDHAIPIGAQDALIRAADAFTPGNLTRTTTLQSSHSPFFSMPEQLASVLIQIAESTV
jgi:pimeloyl-ACP methyl ester carboxylesterase